MSRTASLRQHAARRLFRLGDAEAGEVVLSQRRVFILPTRAGLLYCAMLVVLFLTSINYNLSLGFALTFLLAACALVDMHLTHRNLAHLHLLPGRAHAVFAGAEAQFELHMLNRRTHDRFAIRIGFVDADAGGIEHATDIAAQQSSKLTLSMPTAERGWLPAPRIRLQTRFPLGLMRAWAYWRPDLRVLVYPRPEEHAPALPFAQGQKTDGRGVAGHEDFAGIRPYQAGDSLRQLAWRQIARSDQRTLIAKQFEGGAASELVLDFQRLPQAMDTELKLSRMAAWVLAAEMRGLPYAFRLGDLYFPPATGPAHQAACLQALALHEHST
ncbi:MAG TPA: DUF58 domain-containing protein [Oxalicibacterium sp.]|nr:DUF58 domain-containing protein [Oxalicibacterium sp.]